MSEEHQYNFIDHEHRFTPAVQSIEGDVVHELPLALKTMSLFDELFIFSVEYFDCRRKRYEQIRYWFRTFIEFSSLFTFFGIIIMMAILS
jgi:hypothetical protein